MLQSFRTMLGRLQEMWKSIRPRHLWLGVFALVIVGSFLFVQPTFAQEGLATGVGDWLLRQVAKIMLVVASLSIGLSIFFLRFFIMIASYNNYIDVSVVQLGWVMVRDIANMFFVVALLLIAFGTILGLEEYEWKKNLAKLILSAILINFSNLIAQLCIDVAHIFTITFLNAISATAGGNLVNMFKLDQILALTAVQDTSGLDVEILAAVLPAMLFAIMAAAAIGSYVVVMAARVVALWALIVISPLAFILGVIPQTKTYADKWWAEFSKYVIVAPIMVFFLWLSFATVGLGSIATEIEAGLPDNVRTSGAEAQFGVQRLSMSKVTSWENMANFLIAFAFLMYGIKATQETGTLGSGMIGSAVDFGKKVATIATGYAAGRWLVGKSKDAAVGATKATADFLVGDKIEMLKNFAKRETIGAYQNWRSQGPQWERVKEKVAKDELIDRDLTAEEKLAGFTIQEKDGKKYKTAGLSEVEKIKGYSIVEEKDEKTGEIAKFKKYSGNKYNIKTDESGNVIYKKNADGTFALNDKNEKIAEGMDVPLYESPMQKYVHKRYTNLIASRKRLEKVENDTKMNDEMIDKSIEAQPTHWLSSKNPSMGKEYDRVKRGRLEMLEARSKAKTDEFASEGRAAEAASYRYKDGRFQTERGTMAEQIASHEGVAAQYKSQFDDITKAARKRFLRTDKGANAFQGKIKADLEVKAKDASISNLEGAMTTKVSDASIADTIKANQEIKRYREQLKADEANDELPPEKFYEKQQEVLTEMLSKGLIGIDDYERANRYAEINRAMKNNGGDKETALSALVNSGMIKKEEKEAFSKEMGAGISLNAFPKDRVNVFQRTIQDEKAAHLEAERVETLKKEQEAIFAEGDHGKAEVEEVAVLKERIAAAEGKIKKEDAEGKQRATADQAFINARAAKIAAEKQAHTAGEEVSTLEKEAERDYTLSDHGQGELERDEILKERTSAAEQEIKREAAAAKKTVSEGNEEFIEAQARRLASEKQTSSRDAAVQRDEKQRAAEVAESGLGRAEQRAEELAKEQAAAAEARVKQQAAQAKAGLSDTSKQYQAAQAERIAADKQAKSAESRSSTAEKQAEQKFTESSVGQQILEEEAVLKAQLGSADNIIKRLEADAKARVIAGTTESIDPVFAREAYANFLKTQSATKVVTDTITTDEKIKSEDSMKEIMKEGLKINEEIAKLEHEISTNHSTASAPHIADIAEKEKILRGLRFTKKRLEKATEEAKTETERIAASTALATFETTNEGKEDALIEEIKNKSLLVKTADENDSVKKQENDAKRNRIKSLKQDSVGWRFASSKARAEESSRDLMVKQNTLLNDVEQIEVYSKRGIQAPTTAITEQVEKYEKEFSQMTYEMTVKNMRSSLREMLSRQKKAEDIERREAAGEQISDSDRADAEISDSDKAALAGLFKHAFNKGYTDDGIPAIMDDPELATFAKTTLGWKDQIMNGEKINQIEALFATGANKKFVGMHAQIGKMSDIAEDKFNMDEKEFFEKWENNSFSDEEKKEFIAGGVDLNHVLGADGSLAKANATAYLQTNEDNQAQLQLIGNLRDDSIERNHAESGGHSQYKEVKAGKSMFIMKGAKSARNYVYSDLNKTGIATRVAQHSHASFDLDEVDGIVDRSRVDDLRINRGNINNPNDRRGTNARLSNQSLGLSALEDSTQYLASDKTEAAEIDEDGRLTGQNSDASGAFLVTGQKKDGTQASIVKNRKRNERTKEAMKAAKNEAQMRCVAVADQINSIIADQLRVSRRDFLLNTAEKSGVDQNVALATGQMNQIVSYWDTDANNGEGGEVRVRIDNINKLIGLYNNGKFGAVTTEQKLNKYTPPKETRPASRPAPGQAPAPEPIPEPDPNDEPPTT